MTTADGVANPIKAIYQSMWRTDEQASSGKALSLAARVQDLAEYRAKGRGHKILRVGGRVRPHVIQI